MPERIHLLFGGRPSAPCQGLSTLENLLYCLAWSQPQRTEPMGMCSAQHTCHLPSAACAVGMCSGQWNVAAQHSQIYARGA